MILKFCAVHKACKSQAPTPRRALQGARLSYLLNSRLLQEINGIDHAKKHRKENRRKENRRKENRRTVEYRISNVEGEVEGREMSKGNRTFDLEERLIDFAVRILRMAESLPKTKAGSHIAGQLIRCGTSPGPNYGEAQAAESRADFVHKMKICLKELRETRIWLLIIVKANLITPASKLEPLIDENNELISIFVKSIKTAKQKNKDPS